ncbi:MAG: DUF167 domain-containing protein [Actinomycetota bacterium]|nr:DUF167 domain-containing protein [Actinomycetota bacterium]
MRVVPGSSAAKLVGLHGDELRIKVCSPPLEGRANAEVAEVLAAALGVRAREVQLTAGHTSRSKQLVVHLPVAEVVRRLAPWISPESAAER